MLGYGHPLALGRDFLEPEGTPGHDNVVILGHRLWRDRFGGDPAIVGTPIRIDRRPYTVVGVLGAGPADDNQNQLWVPLAFSAADQVQPRFPLALRDGPFEIRRCTPSGEREPRRRHPQHRPKLSSRDVRMERQRRAVQEQLPQR